MFRLSWPLGCSSCEKLWHTLCCNYLKLQVELQVVSLTALASSEAARRTVPDPVAPAGDGRCRTLEQSQLFLGVEAV